ncbi:AMP-binding protein [Pseudarthrobacter sp. HLT3-5]|uniref:AMP-binding protein n=1 Tax=Pseudarthrobacter cellobiosi TaxID=2953654 RepID=UPI00208DF31D|nr:AMP-binding protein [Pseudarthrobacter sp. HLT3-5]MCO4275978.1 AMP-binding protein [Pseudarthrobacter sp. HLT3-5]
MTTIELPNETPLSPLRFLQRSAEVFGHKTAILHGVRSYTYRDFAAEAQRLAKVIKSRIQPGDRVAFLCPNVPELLIAHYAVPLAGGVLVALNSRMTARELQYILEHSEAKLLFADSELLGTVAGLDLKLTQLLEIVEVPDSTISSPEVPAGVSATQYADFLAAPGCGDPDLPWGVRDERAPITLNYTSGTTGKPKGVLYSHRGAYLNSLGETFHNQFTGATRYLWTLPMFHCNGWCTTWAVTAVAGVHICLRAVRADAVWDAIDTLGVTNLCGAPTVCSIIAEAPQAHGLKVPLRITTAGAPPSPSIITALDSLGISVVHVYGLTEVYGPYTICEYQTEWDDLSAQDRAVKISRQGVGMLQAETARIVDPDMRDVPADGATLGEIVLRGNNVMLGYFKDPEATAEAFRGGWFHTGDLGVMHPDGYIQLKDRAKDIIISGGENISTIEVEQAIISHPAVLDVAVIGVPHEKWGERPVAFVIRSKTSSVTAEEIRSHVKGLIAGFKVPDRILFPEELPHNSTGKVLKARLRALGSSKEISK